jgi:hypothetical protein
MKDVAIMPNLFLTIGFEEGWGLVFLSTVGGEGKFYGREKSKEKEKGTWSMLLAWVLGSNTT